MKDVLKPLLGISILLILVYLAGRFFRTQAGKDEDVRRAYEDWKRDVDEIANEEQGKVMSDDYQKERALDLLEALNENWFGVIPDTDEDRIYNIMKGFQSVDDFVRFETVFNTQYRWNGKTLMQSLKAELDRIEYDTASWNLKQAIGIPLATY